MPLYAETVASAARVKLNHSDLCKPIRSCSIISVPGSAVTKRASGVSRRMLVDQDYTVQNLPKNSVGRTAQKPSGLIFAFHSRCLPTEHPVETAWLQCDESRFSVSTSSFSS